ncbi:MAG: hypothetical protein J7K72_01495 [Candidatus Aenigmarchaeota archaeon]|nr:hypothetical protein [Candidatus Aenigmarchaeota archaeon]
MRLSLELVVIAIVILVVALVVLTMFGGSMGHLGTLTAAKNNCMRTGEFSCKSTGNYPSGWTTDKVGPNGETCSELVNCVCEPNTRTWSCV